MDTIVLYRRGHSGSEHAVAFHYGASLFIVDPQRYAQEKCGVDWGRWGCIQGFACGIAHRYRVTVDDWRYSGRGDTRYRYGFVPYCVHPQYELLGLMWAKELAGQRVLATDALLRQLGESNRWPLEMWRHMTWR